MSYKSTYTGDQIDAGIAKAETSVQLSGNQSIDGIKSFSRLTQIGGGQAYGFNWIQSAGSLQAYKIASLPASAGGTFDQIGIEGVGGGWAGSTKCPFLFYAGNRDGLDVKYIYGKTGGAAHVDLYTESDGSISVWAVLDSASWSVLSVNITVAYSNGYMTIYPNPASGTPTGTRSFSTAINTPALPIP